MLARQLNTEANESAVYAVDFIDEDMQKQQIQEYNIPATRQVAYIPDVVTDLEIKHIIIAIPSLRNGELKRIIDFANETEVQVQMLPKLEDLASGRVSVSNLK